MKGFIVIAAAVAAFTAPAAIAQTHGNPYARVSSHGGSYNQGYVNYGYGYGYNQRVNRGHMGNYRPDRRDYRDYRQNRHERREMRRDERRDHGYQNRHR
ncbi:MAG: hypothetical protein KYX64_10565 [Sphingopyxis sp.]|nr:hypothetical protein [Sphingopyxis sp.]